MPSLGVNIDHIANVRESRKTVEPDPVSTALLAEIGGADGITVHLREDRRHIQDRDVRLLRETLQSRLNLEIAATKEMIDIAKEIHPDMVTLVPERREEITTEGGLNIISNQKNLQSFIKELKNQNIPTSLFVDPNNEQIEACLETGAEWIEIHTGAYAEACWSEKKHHLSLVIEATIKARNLGLRVNAGHGLTYQNVEAIASIKGIEELNIGHTIISRAISVGLKEAVAEMKKLIVSPRKDFIF